MSKVLRELRRDAQEAYGAWKSAAANGEDPEAVQRLKANAEEAEKAYFDETYEAELRDYEETPQHKVGRHDVPSEFRELLEAAVVTELADPMTIYTLATMFGDRLEKVVEELTEYAWANRHDMRRIYYIVDAEEAADLKVGPGVKKASPELRRIGQKGLKTQKEIIGHYIDKAHAALT